MSFNKEWEKYERQEASADWVLSSNNQKSWDLINEVGIIQNFTYITLRALQVHRSINWRAKMLPNRAPCGKMRFPSGYVRHFDNSLMKFQKFKRYEAKQKRMRANK